MTLARLGSGGRAQAGTEPRSGGPLFAIRCSARSSRRDAAVALAIDLAGFSRQLRSQRDAFSLRRPRENSRARTLVRAARSPSFGTKSWIVLRVASPWLCIAT